MGAAAGEGDFATPAAPPAPARAAGGGVYQVGGVPVEFPYKPYGTQLAFMGRVIATLDRARRQGRSHALLESPTGTGKSLSLLCSALAWQRHYPLRAPPPPPAADPFLHGGGFVPDDTQKQATPGVAEKAPKKKNVPTIYYATRTHAQITQVVREYRKTSYRVRMAILASRKHYCVNKNVCMSGNIDELCKSLLDDSAQGCPEYKNAQKLSRHPSLQIGGCYEVHDIEDLVRVGRKVKGCPYFAAQTMAEAAQLVFCPYNYLISPIVRRAMDIDVSGSIIVLDEAHNIEDIARDAGSFDADEESLLSLQQELESLCTDEAVAMIYEPLLGVIAGLNNWIDERANGLQNNEFEHPASFWTGEEAMKELQCASITPVYFPILQECATKAVKAASDAESDGAHLSGGSAMTLESLFSSLSYFFAENGCHSNDYQLALQRFAKREGNSVIGWKCLMSLWCLNPAVVFRGIADLSLSVILTSGTLSPMGSFASELGVLFDACMEAPHVINVDSQVFSTVLSSGPTGRRLNASYRTANEHSFQDELGATLEEICRIVPGGALVFFPSYNLLDKLQRRWSQTGQWARLEAQKHVCVEPRGSTEELEPVLKGYYNAILGKAPPKKGRCAKQILKNRVTKGSSQDSAKGAALLAVCRGKVSEGIDFSDDKARVVVIVGIPFPNINDVQVKLKKRFNDSYKSPKNLLSGNEWYCHQAFRALNQAAGRCIRHKFDYGGIVLIDERYQEERNLVYISKWLRNSIRNCSTFQETLDGLARFFQNAEEHIKIKGQDVSPKDTLDACVLPSYGDKRKLLWAESNFSNQIELQDVKSECHSGKASKIDGAAGVDHMKLPDTSSEAWHISSKDSGSVRKQISPVPENLPIACQLRPSYKVQNNLEDKADDGTNYEVKINVIDLEECDAKPRYAKLIIFNPSEHITQQSTVLEETYASPIASPSNHSEANTATVKEGDPTLDLPISLSAADRNISCVSTSAATPERSSSRSQLEHESWTNRSVNSHFQKRRKLSSPMSCCTYTEHSPSKPFFQGSCDVSMLPGDLRTDGVCCRSTEMSRCENIKVERNKKLVEFPSRVSTQEKLFLCCARCKTALGLQEDGFLVSCSSSLSSKFFLTHLWRHGTPADILTGKDFSAPSPLKIKVMICNVSSLNKMILGNLRNESSAHNSGIWSEKDGCVYKAVTCHTCCKNGCVTTLGAQVVATDSSNQQFCDKVLLFDDLLYVKHRPSKDQPASAPINTVKPILPPPVIDLESFAYKPLKKDPVAVNTRRSKLRLPGTAKSRNGA
ncbi:Fanconi anemia group J protein homolog [Oryza brachyantha]|uniref:Fanconi anemia group J protein homolog n=1 Tax=Oryza brachyantha TaxID=4533 RepID=UPI001AD9A69C|nr:Fanconi anemia group J protein homolog [Oryza brachyantha]